MEKQIATERDKPRFKLCIELEDEFKAEWNKSLNLSIQKILIDINNDDEQVSENK